MKFGFVEDVRVSKRNLIDFIRPTASELTFLSTEGEMFVDDNTEIGKFIGTGEIDI